LKTARRASQTGHELTLTCRAGKRGLDWFRSYRFADSRRPRPPPAASPCTARANRDLEAFRTPLSGRIESAGQAIQQFPDCRPAHESPDQSGARRRWRMIGRVNGGTRFAKLHLGTSVRMLGPAIDPLDGADGPEGPEPRQPGQRGGPMLGLGGCLLQTQRPGGSCQQLGSSDHRQELVHGPWTLVRWGLGSTGGGDRAKLSCSPDRGNGATSAGASAPVCQVGCNVKVLYTFRERPDA
jgi:hypothetical protein